MSSSTIFATGAAGYVGSHCVAELLEKGYNVIVADNFSNAHKDSNGKPVCINKLEEITGKKITFYEADLRNKHTLNPIFSENNIDCVIHFAALKAVGESTKIPLEYYKNNVSGTINLLEAMKENGVKSFVFSSSAMVYGDIEYLPLDEKHPTGHNCTNPYGKSKHFIEEILKDICQSDPVWKVVILRYFNPVGAHKSGKIGEDPLGYPNNLMPYISQVASGKRKLLQVFGNDYDTKDGTGIRDYIHVMDLAGGHLAALNKIMEPGFSGNKVYNLGTGQGHTVLEVISAFETASGKKIPYNITERRAGDVAILQADVTLAAEELKWKAKLGLLDMCADTWRWIQNSSAN